MMKSGHPEDRHVRVVSRKQEPSNEIKGGSAEGARATHRPGITESAAPSVGKPKIFISYAWGEDSSALGRHRGQIVDALCHRLESESWEVVRDTTTMRWGDLISTFIKSISRADLVLLVLSDKYLRSPYCMAELYGIYQRVEGDKEDFLNHVVPLMLDDAKFSSAADRIKIAEHWTHRFKRWRSR